MRFPYLFVLCILIFGCGVTTPEYNAPPAEDNPPASATLNQGYDDAWNSLISFTSERFFAIDNYEKESGLMTLKFSANPSRFVTCGEIDTDGPPAYSGPYLDWYDQRRATPELDGRMNLTVREISSEEVRVEVNARYVLSISYPTGSQLKWAFNTGGSDTITVPANNFGARQDRTCRPTHEAERVIVEGLKELSSS